MSVIGLEGHVRKLETKQTDITCSECGGPGRRVVVYPGDPEPEGCPRCGRLIIVRVVYTAQRKLGERLA